MLFHCYNHCTKEPQCYVTRTLYFVLFSTTYIKASTPDITTLPVMGSNIIFQEVGYSENSTISLFLRTQAVLLSHVAINFQAWRMEIVTVIHFERNAISIFLILQLTRD